MPGKNKRPVAYKLNIRLLEEAEDYRLSLGDLPPTKTAIMEAALREYLDRHKKPRRAARRA